MSLGAKNTVIDIETDEIETKRVKVQLCWMGCVTSPTHWCYPTTDRRGNFWLLPLGPDPVCSSLVNLDLPSFQGKTISTPNIVRTPDRHSTRQQRAPILKRFTNPGLQVTELQTHATTPSRLRTSIIISSFPSFDTPPFSSVFIHVWKFSFDLEERESANQKT